MRGGGIFTRPRRRFNPELADYLNETGRYPQINSRPPANRLPGAMVQQPPLESLFAEPEVQLNAPLPLPGSELTAPGIAFSALVEPSGAFEGDYRAPELERRGLEPPPGPGGLSLYDSNTAALRDARHRTPILMQREAQAAEAERIRRISTPEGRLERMQGDLRDGIGQAWDGFSGAVRHLSQQEIERRQRRRERVLPVVQNFTTDLGAYNTPLPDDVFPPDWPSQGDRAAEIGAMDADAQARSRASPYWEGGFQQRYPFAMDEGNAYVLADLHRDFVQGETALRRRASRSPIPRPGAPAISNAWRRR